MNKLLVLALLAAGCDGYDHRPLTALGEVSADVYVNVGVPAIPYSGEEESKYLSLSLGYTAPGCLSLETDAEAKLDGRPSDYEEIGYWTENDVHGVHEAYCVYPAFYFDYLPDPRDVDTVTLIDSSARFAVDVPRLLTNPAITIGELRRGAQTTVQIDDPRPMTKVKAWYRADYNDPSQSYFGVEATVTGSDIHFTVPTTARGTGTVGIEWTSEQPDHTCSGFSSCTVTVRGGASFPVTIQ